VAIISSNIGTSITQTKLPNYAQHPKRDHLLSAMGSQQPRFVSERKLVLPRGKRAFQLTLNVSSFSPPQRHTPHNPIQSSRHRPHSSSNRPDDSGSSSTAIANVSGTSPRPRLCNPAKDEDPNAREVLGHAEAVDPDEESG
jgi:hypothetical protein